VKYEFAPVVDKSDKHRDLRDLHIVFLTCYSQPCPPPQLHSVAEPGPKQHEGVPT
jgi:hypothetical protein